MFQTDSSLNVLTTESSVSFSFSWICLILVFKHWKHPSSVASNSITSVIFMAQFHLVFVNISRRWRNLKQEEEVKTMIKIPMNTEERCTHAVIQTHSVCVSEGQAPWGRAEAEHTVDRTMLTSWLMDSRAIFFRPLVHSREMRRSYKKKTKKKKHDQSQYGAGDDKRASAFSRVHLKEMIWLQIFLIISGLETIFLTELVISRSFFVL